VGSEEEVKLRRREVLSEMARQAGTARYSVLVEMVKILLSMFLFLWS